MKIKFIQDLIDRLRGKMFGGKEILLKALCMNKNPEYHTLALGSSHMACGFIPEENEINLASASQDLYYTYKLYEIYNHEKLKNLIISFSVFSPNDILIKSNSASIAVLFKLLFNIDYQFKDIAINKNLYELEEKYNKNLQILQKTIKLPEKYRGEKVGKPKHNFNEKLIEKRALAHYKINKKNSNQIEYLNKLLSDTSLNNQRIIIVIPPVMQKYKAFLPNSNILFEKLFLISKKYPNSIIINLYDSNDFTNKDFCDGDHLNNRGAVKMTKAIRRIINE